MRWQNLKREYTILSDIFNKEPYKEALIAFKNEYIKRLGQRYNWDKKIMQERSELLDFNLNNN